MEGGGGGGGGEVLKILNGWVLSNALNFELFFYQTFLYCTCMIMSDLTPEVLFQNKLTEFCFTTVGKAPDSLLK